MTPLAAPGRELHVVDYVLVEGFGSAGPLHQTLPNLRNCTSAGLVSLPSPRSSSRRRLPILSLLLAPFFSIVTITSFLAHDLLYRTGLKVSVDASRLCRRIKEVVLADSLGRFVL